MNEVNLLQLKIAEELHGGVDKFIVVESSCTFSGFEKPLILANSNFPSQIVVVQAGEEMANVPKHTNIAITPFQREAIQRNAALKDIIPENDDIIISSDIDEIFTHEDISRIVDAVRKHGFVHLLQDRFYYKLNLWSNETWYHAFAVTGEYLKGKTLNQLRNKNAVRIPTQGKHFSYIMPPDQISFKLKSFSHINYAISQYSDPNIIRDRIERRQDLFGRDIMKRKVKLGLIPVKIDEGFPKFIFAQWDMWKEWIDQEAKISLEDAKKYIPIIDSVPKEDMSEFYANIDDFAITFPWRNTTV